MKIMVHVERTGGEKKGDYEYATLEAVPRQVMCGNWECPRKKIDLRNGVEDMVRNGSCQGSIRCEGYDTKMQRSCCTSAFVVIEHDRAPKSL